MGNERDNLLLVIHAARTWRAQHKCHLCRFGPGCTDDIKMTMAHLEATERMITVDPEWSAENYRRLQEGDSE